MTSAAEYIRAPDCATGRLQFNFAEWCRLAGFYGVVALLHVAGWGVYLHYASVYPAMVGLGLAAYLLGLRHAFDADHIAAVDDTARFLMQKGKRPLGVGFFFSLGHATVVLLLAIAIIFAGDAVKQYLPVLRNFGGVIGSAVSGVFLWIIGLLNLMILMDIYALWRTANPGDRSHAHAEDLLARRGLLNRLFGGRLPTIITQTWQMFPLGLLFGLGFDTASEIALLGMTAGATVANLPILAGLSVPILFAAGMSLVDTTDGVLMVKAYEWAYKNPLSKLFYNMTITGLSVAVALVIGTIELLQVFIGLLDLKGSLFDHVAVLDTGVLGYLIVGALISTWVVSLALWKLRGKQPKKL